MDIPTLIVLAIIGTAIVFFAIPLLGQTHVSPLQEFSVPGQNSLCGDSFSSQFTAEYQELTSGSHSTNVNMDGRNYTVIISGDKSGGLAIDLTNCRLARGSGSEIFSIARLNENQPNFKAFSDMTYCLSLREGAEDLCSVIGSVQGILKPNEENLKIAVQIVPPLAKFLGDAHWIPVKVQRGAIETTQFVKGATGENAMFVLDVVETESCFLSENGQQEARTFDYANAGRMLSNRIEQGYAYTNGVADLRQITENSQTLTGIWDVACGSNKQNLQQIDSQINTAIQNGNNDYSTSENLLSKLAGAATKAINEKNTARSRNAPTDIDRILFPVSSQQYDSYGSYSAYNSENLNYTGLYKQAIQSAGIETIYYENWRYVLSWEKAVKENGDRLLILLGIIIVLFFVFRKK